MMNKLTTLFAAAAMALGTAGPSQAASEADSAMIKRDAIKQLLEAHRDDVPPTFDGFLKQVDNETDNQNLQSAIDNYLNKKPLAGADFVNTYRLLGIYNRLQYGQDVIDLLGEMVAIDTSKKGDKPQHENPNIQQFGELIKAKAQAFGLNYRNVDNRVFEVELPGSSDEAFGILTHGDVVPASAEGWTLDDGTEINPFETTRIDGKLYGRGTEDDKASIAAALYAMKSIKENHVPLKRTIRLMIETTEETGGEGYEYYKAHNDLPDYNIVLDSGYPAVIAENGFGTIDAFFPRVDAQGSGPVITDITGGLATNQIPATSVATIQSADPEALSQKLEAAGKRYVEDNGGDFQVTTAAQDNTVKVTVKGKSAHSSKPESGVNPVPRMAGLLVASGVPFQDNHYTAAIHYIDDNYGLDYHGTQLGVAYRHDFMGPLEVSPTYLELKDDKLRVAVNVRAPAGEKSVEELASTIQDKLVAYRDENDVNMDVNVEISDWMLRDPKGQWLQTLLNIFGDTTGLDATPVSSAGSTTAKLLPNAINFGPSMPGETYTGHTSSEFKRVDNLMLDIQMFTEMLARIGNQEQLD